MSIDIDGLNTKQLAELIERASSQLSTKTEEERAEVREEVKKLAESRGFTIEELYGGKQEKPKRKKVVPVYCDPENAENTWTGRGRKPRWVITALDAGKSLESMKIDQRGTESN